MDWINCSNPESIIIEDDKTAVINELEMHTLKLSLGELGVFGSTSESEAIMECPSK